MTSIKPKNYGVIVRTVAEGKAVEEMERDLKESIAKWEEGIKKLVDAKPAERIIGEMSRATSMLRDLLNNDFDNVIVDSQELYNEAKDYVHNVAPEKEKIVKLHTGKTKLFEQIGIEKQLKMLFGRSVSLPDGGYLIVEHTEALHVIDVNSGNKSNKEDDQEATALSVNREAAKEIARQLRLRDMGGIIVIDFIDMKRAENRKLIQDIMRDEMRGDRSKYTILPLTKFGLMQITRQRVRPEMNVSTHENCPSCGGTGSITASIAVSEIVAQHVEHLVLKQNEKKLTILVHPFLHAYFTKGFPSIRMNWFIKYKTWISMMEDSSFGITEFKFLNQNGDEIEISS
jgi:ribonuclease G